MQRYECLPMSYADIMPISLDVMRQRLEAAGAVSIREAHVNGWQNQPMTLRFNAADDDAASAIVSSINDPGAKWTQYRAYGLHWRDYGKD